MANRAGAKIWDPLVFLARNARVPHLPTTPIASWPPMLVSDRLATDAAKGGRRFAQTPRCLSPAPRECNSRLHKACSGQLAAHARCCGLSPHPSTAIFVGVARHSCRRALANCGDGCRIGVRSVVGRVAARQRSRKRSAHDEPRCVVRCRPQSDLRSVSPVVVGAEPLSAPPQGRDLGLYPAGFIREFGVQKLLQRML